MSKHCSRIKNIIAIKRQEQEGINNFIIICHPFKSKKSSKNIHKYASPDKNVRIRFIHVKQIETPSFWWLLQQQGFAGFTGPIVQIENIGIIIMVGNLMIVFTVPFKPTDIINKPSAWKMLGV